MLHMESERQTRPIAAGRLTRILARSRTPDQEEYRPTSLIFEGMDRPHRFDTSGSRRAKAGRETLGRGARAQVKRVMESRYVSCSRALLVPTDYSDSLNRDARCAEEPVPNKRQAAQQVTPRETAARCCLHCAMERAMRKESASLADSGVHIVIRQSEVFWLPISGARVYRRLRRFLRGACLERMEGTVEIAALTWLKGKSHVEVTAKVTGRHGLRVFSCTFPRHVLDTLWLGFREGLYEGN